MLRPALCRRTLNDIQEKLDKMLSFLPEIQTLKTRVSELEKEKDALREGLEFTQAELHELKNNTTSTAAMLTSTTKKLAKLDELERRVIRQECLKWYYDQKITFIFSSDFETMFVKHSLSEIISVNFGKKTVNLNCTFPV